MKKHTVNHPFHPISDERSSVLILGTMPSIKSLEAGFYYAHPRNRFWPVVTVCFGEQTPETVEERIRLLLSNGLALWDVVANCEVSGSEDSSISNPVYNDISKLVTGKLIRKVLCNGKKAYNLCRRLDLPVTVLCMPSTSPANASWSTERLIEVLKLELTESRPG